MVETETTLDDTPLDAAGARPALLLDRDGVINVDKQFVARREDFEWRHGIFRLLALATDHGIPIVVVTNQSGIGRGYYSQEDFDTLNRWMCDELADRNTPVARVYHCPFHPQARMPSLRANHPWRKPSPGMILAAQADLDLDLAASVLIGDQWSDAIAGQRAAVGHLALVGEPRAATPTRPPPALRFADITSVADWYAAHLASNTGALGKNDRLTARCRNGKHV